MPSSRCIGNLEVVEGPKSTKRFPPNVITSLPDGEATTRNSGDDYDFDAQAFCARLANQ